MESIVNLLNKISIHTFDVGSEHWVDVTHINNPHSFYVRPTFYRSYLPVLHEFNESTVPENLHPGSIVVYKSQVLKSYVRGRVMFIQDEEESGASCDLFALDYGCFERSIPLEELRKTPHSFHIPPLATHCELADCKPLKDNWCKEAIESMKFFIGKERAKMIVRSKSPESITIELYNTCPDDIATMLMYDGHTILGYSDNMINRLTSMEPEKHFYIFKKHEVGDVLTVRTQSGDSLKNFFVSEVEDFKSYLHDRDDFTYTCKQLKGFEPDEVKVGMGVGVLMITSNKYERALVTDITVPEEKVMVMLVDWGKSMEVPISRLKPMSAKFFQLPATAILCSAEESQVWDNGLHKFLYPGYTFNVTIVQLGEQYESPHVVHISPVEN